MTQVSTAIRNDSRDRWRFYVFALLTLSEMLITSYFFNFPIALPEWANPVAYAKIAAQAVLVSAVVLFVLVWPQRAGVLAAWNTAMQSSRWRASVLANLCVFAVLLAATLAFSGEARATGTPWLWFAAYCILLVLTASSLAVTGAPVEFWRWLLRQMPSEIGIAAIAGTLIVAFSRLALEGWSSLAGATLRASHWILSLYESDVILDTDQMLLGAGDFHVLVLKQCSGYEGVGLVTAYIAFYCWASRRQLRFPRALLLLPMGIAAALTLNAVRIALLVSIGRHISPEMALNGFHSQAGWIAFLAIAVALTAISIWAPYFRAEQRSGAPPQSAADEMLLALLVPFIALMAASVVASLFAPYEQGFYALKVVAVGGSLCVYRRVYASLLTSVSPLAPVIGAGIGLAWVLTDPGGGSDNAVAVWLEAIPAWLAVVWLACRGLGTVVLVPFAEELAFRGYLQRVFISRDFLKVAPNHFTWLSFLATSLLFGMIHERWLAATLAGAVYAVLLYRSNRLSDAIAAHAASNAVIFIWAVAAHQWSLL